MKIHSTGDIDFKPWWTGLHLSCPDCGSIYELESGDTDRLHFSDRGMIGECLHYDCNRCGHGIYAERYLIDRLRSWMLKNVDFVKLPSSELSLSDRSYIRNYLYPTGFKLEGSDIDGRLYDISKLGYCGNMFNGRNHER